MTTEEAIKDLAEEARRIGKQHYDQEAAWEMQLAAQADLLGAVLTAIGSALPAICSRVDIENRANGYVPAPWKGVRISGDLDEGRALYLNEHGALIEVVYLRGEGRSWKGGWFPITPRHTVSEYELAPIIEALTRSLIQQAKGSAIARTAMFQQRAAQLHAVADMLRGMK